MGLSQGWGRQGGLICLDSEGSGMAHTSSADRWGHMVYLMALHLQQHFNKFTYLVPLEGIQNTIWISRVAKAPQVILVHSLAENHCVAGSGSDVK